MNRLVQGLIACILSYTASFSQYSAQVRTINGRPTLEINGKVTLPIIYAPTHATGGRWSWEEVPQRNIKNFCEAGIQIFQLDVYFEDLWHKGTDTLDMTKAYNQIAGVAAVCPEAKIFLRVHVNAPFWWNEANQDECTQYANGQLQEMTYGLPLNLEDGDTERSLRASMASVKWKIQAGARLEEFCKKLELSTWNKYMVGLHICAGVFGEWHYWGFPENSPDTGPAMTTYFRQWLKRKYKTDANLQKAWKSKAYTLINASVPDTNERYQSQYGDYRDVQKEQRIIDYFTCQQQLVADNIEYFCRIAKQNWPRPWVIGVFYGYFQLTFSHQARGGHLCVQQILNSPYIDYLSWPTAYWYSSQELGGSGNARGISESCLLHGKLFLEELDNGYKQTARKKTNTHVEMKKDIGFFAMTRRNIWRPVLRGGGMWFYDFGLTESRGWWDLPEYMQDIKAQHQILSAAYQKPFKSESDVLVVYDQESFYYIKDQWTPMSYDFLDQTTEELCRSGTLIDQIYLFDLPKVDLKKYKAIVFMNIYKVDTAMQKFIKTKVHADKRTVVYQYLPGITDGSKTNVQLSSSLMGIELKEVMTPPLGKPLVTIPSLNLSYELPKYPTPWVQIVPGKEKTWGTLSDEKSKAIVQYDFPTHTLIYATSALHNPKIFQTIFKNAGAHIYCEMPITLYESSGFLYVHIKESGDYSIKLRNGKEISISVLHPVTLGFDTNTGKCIME